MRNLLGFFSGLAFVVLLAVGMDAHAQTDFDPVAWSQTPEGAEQIAGYFFAGMFFPMSAYVIGKSVGLLLSLIGGGRS